MFIVEEAAKRSFQHRTENNLFLTDMYAFRRCWRFALSARPTYLCPDHQAARLSTVQPAPGAEPRLLETCLAIRTTAQELHRWMEGRRAQPGAEGSSAALVAAAAQLVTAAQQARVSRPATARGGGHGPSRRTMDTDPEPDTDTNSDSDSDQSSGYHIIFISNGDLLTMALLVLLRWVLDRLN